MGSRIVLENRQRLSEDVKRIEKRREERERAKIAKATEEQPKTPIAPRKE